MAKVIQKMTGWAYECQIPQKNGVGDKFISCTIFLCTNKIFLKAYRCKCGKNCKTVKRTVTITE